ncbi:hypothetical protein A2765_05400 [Candidatus Kaiserbacteria bacterium RIFCSPHIGHO2_01_FULL_56_24]|uniref:Calx-beta domain-containing protein n=1 Tax=Candidatus Kaiserbacteria bacterium RIFCSPHIGHO2_01_FULL_56_24 TaxID=1798487 RepID=A0A1F6D9Z2_9BACT|nr:MAG: hypothetical protein A2765_05400 [Candidatus Kaiserbacteria bacterium RIFCSPHIGHO2_01_FULL_56_24]
MITFIRTGGAEGSVSVEYTLTDGTAKAAEDYVKSDGTLTFAAGETSRSLSIDIIDDDDSESDETLTVILAEPEGGAAIGSPTSATITIDDDEGGGGSQSGVNQPTLRFAALNYAMSEKEGSVTIIVERVGGSAGTASVSYATVEGTARSTIDYTTTTGTLQFAAGETEKSFSVPLKDDSSTEGNEKLQLKLTNPAGAVLDQERLTADLTIVDDEVITSGTGSLRFGEAEYTVGEDNDVLMVTVMRSGGTKGNVSVTIKSANGTAKATEDFEKVDTTITFRAGEAEKIFAITILSDDKDDPDELFTLSLSAPTNGAALGSPKDAEVMIQQ